MAEYTKIETARAIICDFCNQLYSDEPCEPADCDWLRMIEEDAADVAPVVRCKDCKYYRVGVLLAPNKFCFRLKHPVEDRPIGYNFAPDDFCSHGERKDGDSDALD